MINDHRTSGRLVNRENNQYNSESIDKNYSGTLIVTGVLPVFLVLLARVCGGCLAGRAGGLLL